MTTQTELRPDIEIGNKPGSNEVRREPGGTRKPHRVLWPIVLLIAMAVAGVVGITVTENLPLPRPPLGSSTRSQTPIRREGRVPARAAERQRPRKSRAHHRRQAAERQRPRGSVSRQPLSACGFWPHFLAFAPT